MLTLEVKVCVSLQFPEAAGIRLRNLSDIWNFTSCYFLASSPYGVVVPASELQFVVNDCIEVTPAIAFSEYDPEFPNTHHSPAEITGSNLTEERGNNILNVAGVQGLAASTSLLQSIAEVLSLLPLTIKERSLLLLDNLVETGFVFIRNSTP